jgi:hypothetical protein
LDLVGGEIVPVSTIGCNIVLALQLLLRTEGWGVGHLQVYCEQCSNYMLPLPEFEKDPNEAEPVKVCYEGQRRRGAIKVRIQSESKKPEEPPLQKRPNIEEEPDDPPDNWEEARYWVSPQPPMHCNQQQYSGPSNVLINILSKRAIEIQSHSDPRPSPPAHA